MFWKKKSSGSQLASSLRTQAESFVRAQQLDKAVMLFDRAEQAARKSGDDDELQHVLGQKAGAYRWKNDLALSMKILKQQEKIVRRIGNADGLQSCLGNQAVLLREMAAQDDDDDKLIEAMKLADEQLKVSIAGKMPYGIQFALGTQALVSRDLRKLDEAKELFERQVGMLREMGHQSELARSLLNLSTLYNELRQPSKSASLLDEAEAIATSLGEVMLMQQAQMARSFASAMHDKPTAESVMEITERAHKHLEKREFETAEKLFGEVLSRMEAPSNFKLLAHAQRAFARAEQNHLTEAIEDYTSVVNWSNTPTDLRAEALNNRASLFGKLNDMAKYTTDLSAVIALAGAPEKMRVEAALRRGNQYLMDGSTEKALLDFTFVSHSAAASERERAEAAFKLGTIWRDQGDHQAAQKAFTDVLGFCGARDETRAWASFMLGLIARDTENWPAAVKHFTAAANSSIDEGYLDSWSLIERGRAYERIGKDREATRDFEAVLALPKATVEHKAEVLCSMAIARDRKRQGKQARKIYAQVLGMEGLPDLVRATALVGQGSSFIDDEEYEQAIASFTKALDIPEIFPHERSKALMGRGEAFAKTGDKRKAIENFDAVIRSPASSADERADAHISKAMIWLDQKRGDALVEECSAIMSIAGVPSRKLTFVADFLSLSFELPAHQTNPQELARLIKLVISAPGISDELLEELRMRLNSLS